MSAGPFTIADLRPVDLFDGLSDDQLEAWVATCSPVEVAAGQLVIEAGQPPPGFMLLLEGHVQTLAAAEGGRLEQVGHQHAPTWMYAIAMLTGMEARVTMRAEVPCRFALIGEEDFVRLVFEHRDVHRRVMGQVQPVMSFITAIEQDRERLASLGTMAAGLAHELNNPAAAASRAASDLGGALKTVSDSLAAFVAAGVERDQAAGLVALQREALAAAEQAEPLGALAAADAEEELGAVLEGLELADAWRLAEPLAAAGIGADWIERVAAQAGPATQPAIEWIAAVLLARSLVGELADATGRISDLVGAIKGYSYMDRGATVEVDLHEGLEMTLKILGHKLKHTEIVVERDFDRSLPPVVVHGSELNQVWTNLIDNAIGALGQSGTITLRTSRQGDRAVVEVIDDGPGIPAADQGRIFDAFYTTKQVGEGTGLGLDMARRIVVQRHNGSISLESQPGHTAFHVEIPLEQPST